MTPKDIIRILESRGFELRGLKVAITFFNILNQKKITVVPVHNKDLPIGTFLAIIRQAGLKRDDL